MNYEAAILYAHQRMREIGKTPEQYHFEPVRISGTDAEAASGLVTIYAYNEVYILVNPENYYGLLILGDDSGFDSDIASNSGAPEFTGIIFLKRQGTHWNLDRIDVKDKPKLIVPVEFLRVVIY